MPSGRREPRHAPDIGIPIGHAGSFGFPKRRFGGKVAAYAIYEGEVLDAERYEQHKTKAAASIVAAGGKYLARGGDVEVLEGDPPAGRTVVVEFPTMQVAVAWYRSDEYTEIRKIRNSAARGRLYIVDGVS
jgi:uncharacterized protein (DUF1330 family)